MQNQDNIHLYVGRNMFVFSKLKCTIPSLSTWIILWLQ